MTHIFDPLLCKNKGCNNEIDSLETSYCMECLMLLESYMDEFNKELEDIRTEHDPSGKPANAPGAKLDAGKIRPSLIFGGMPRALQEVARVGTYGAQKYSENGWQHVENGIVRYTDAMDRHRLKECIEGPYDLDALKEGWHILHASQIAWNALARLELMLRPSPEETSEKAVSLQ
jgi:hypothetical protein